jgi:chromosome segregation ATPase
VLDIYSEFEELREEFKSAQEVYDKLQEKKKETTTLSTIIINKYKGNIKDLESQRTEVIYNLTKAKETAGVDIAERELHLNALSEQINDNKAKQTNIDKSLADMDKLTDGILELKTEESDIIRNANAENIKARGDIENKILEIKHQVAVLESKGIECEHNVSKAQREYSEYSDKLEQQREEYKVLREKEFDDTRSLVCAYCGQEYPQEKKDELRAKFEATKLSELKALSDIGLEYRTIRDNAKESLKVNQEAIAKCQDEITKLDTQCSDLEKQLSEIPTDVDVSDMPRIAQIRSEIAEKDKLIKSMANMQNERTELLNALLGLQSEYDMERIKIEQAQQAQNDVDSLTDRQRELSQQIADNERMKDLVEQFDRAKCKLAEDKINSNFEVIKFKLFETQINGEIKDVCRILVDGEDYERNLNHGSRILAEIDLCKAFQKAYNVELPIMVDDLECLDTWRIPDIPNQLIGFMRTDDKELIVGEF